MMSTENKVLVIGLDGATFDILNPLTLQGYMPHLASLMERGCWGRLSSTIPPFTAAAWSSFSTGRNPGQHGVISFRGTRDRFNYDLQGEGFVDARRFENTLWEILSAEEKRVVIVNVPLTYPVRPVNGYIVTGMLTPSDARVFTYPPGLSQVLGEDYIIDVDFVRNENKFRVRGFPSKIEMITQIRNMSKMRTWACASLMQDEYWDFFMVVFTSTDRVLHFFWDDLETILEQGALKNGEIQQHLQQYFRELDEGIGQLVDLAGPSATVLVVSDHGFGPAPTRRFYVNVWLEHLGLLQKRKSQGVFDLEHWRVVIGRNESLKKLLRRLLPQSVQDKSKEVAVSTCGEIIDWSETRAYFVPIYFHVCGVEINLAGARREGIVAPGKEYESLRTQIINEAQQLEDPVCGKPIVDKAFRREELYRGSYVDEFPDVILILDPDYIAGGSLAGSSLVEHHVPMRPGEHRQDGIFIASGEQIFAQGEQVNLNLLDIPPTILYAMGLPVSSSFDGRVLKEIFDPVHLSANPVKTSTRLFSSKDSSAHSYSESEVVDIEERLRGLGYIE